MSRKGVYVYRYPERFREKGCKSIGTMRDVEKGGCKSIGTLRDKGCKFIGSLRDVEKRGVNI